MKFITRKEGEIYDGPFKVPLPRKLKQKVKQSTQKGAKINAPKPRYRSVDQNRVNAHYQKLLVKLVKTPDQITKHDMQILATHPVVRELLKKSRENCYTTGSFYVPIETILNPQLYNAESVPIIYEAENKISEIKIDQDVEVSTTENSTSGSQESENSKKIGLYTLKERKERILKYKQKQQRNKPQVNIKESRKVSNKRSPASKKVSRKFSRYSKLGSNTSDFITSGFTHSESSCSKELLRSPMITGESSNLNEIVSEITGIY